MLKEIIQQKDQIINHIEHKLINLRQQRTLLEKQKYSAPNQPQNYDNKLFHQKSIKGTLPQKLQLQNNLKQLQKLYQQKKQLQKLGILANNPTQIYKYNNDPKWIKFIDKQKQRKIKQIQQQKIIDQQLIKAKQFLNSKKVQQKQLKSLQLMNYRNILKQKHEQLQQYDSLIKKKRLSRLQKQALVGLTFNLIKTNRQSLDKSILRNFLLANPQFCYHFYITHTQINRDLKVFQTSQSNQLNQQQFYQFVKSIQFTNPKLNPSLKKHKQMLNTQSKKISNNIVNQKQNNKQKKPNERQVFRNMLEYLRKLFNNFDRSKQTIVQRSKFLLAMEKGLYLQKSMQSQLGNIKQLSKYISTKTKQQCKNDYYLELESKYINFPTIQAMCRQYYKTLNKNDQKSHQIQQQLNKIQSNIDEKQKIQQSSYNQQQFNNQQQSQTKSQINLSSGQGKIITEEDYKRYGWNQRNQRPHSSTVPHNISKIDQYYQEVAQKYDTEIRWNGFKINTNKNYQDDFKKLQAFIQLQDMKNGKLKQ